MYFFPRSLQGVKELDPQHAILYVLQAGRTFPLSPSQCSPWAPCKKEKFGRASKAAGDVARVENLWKLGSFLACVEVPSSNAKRG